MSCVAAETPAAHGDEGTTVASIDSRTDLIRALAGLPARQRAVLVLRYFADLPEAEVATRPRLLGRDGEEQRITSAGATSPNPRYRHNNASSWADNRDRQEDHAMNAQLEQELRRALATQAAELPPDASAKLLARDYRPRVAARRTPLALATITVAAGAVLAILLVGLSTGPPRAFAGWSATPTRAADGQSQRAVAVCSSQLANMARRHREPVTRSGNRDRLPSRSPPQAGTRSLSIRVSPTPQSCSRWTAGGRVSTCFVDRRGQASAGTAVGLRPPPPVPAGEVSYAPLGAPPPQRMKAPGSSRWSSAAPGLG